MKNKTFNKELDSQRVFFKRKNLRKEFFILLREQFGTWKAVRNHFNIYKSRLDCFRDGSISIPYKTFNELNKSLTEKDYFLEQIILKNQNWGSVKGGITTYRKHRVRLKSKNI